MKKIFNFLLVYCFISLYIPFVFSETLYQAETLRNPQSLKQTLASLKNIHSVKLDPPDLDSDLDWAYGYFSLKDFLDNGDLYKAVIELIIKTERFSGRDLLYLSELKNTPEENKKYLSLVKSDDKFWHPAISPASTEIAIEIFKINTGLGSNYRLLDIIRKGGKEDLVLILSLPEFIDDKEILKELLN